MALFGRETQQDRQRAEAYALWLGQRNPFAVVSLVLGVFSLIEMGAIPVFSIGGLVCGIVALRQLRRGDSARPLGRRLAWLGTMVSSIALLSGAVLYMLSFLRH